MSSRGYDLNAMIKEEKVFWKNGSLSGEGLWQRTAGDSGVVICHPHPLMGGSMHNNVVETIRDVFSSSDYCTLRFNFRGVGESTGYHDEGRGEKQDILSACAFIKSQGVEKIILAGYSFGAWVCCRLLKDKPALINSVILISPPQKYINFDWFGLEDSVELIICGDSDLFCDAEELRKTADIIHSKLMVCRATDHFYAGQEPLLSEYLRQYIYEKKLDFNKNNVNV
ncbi:MAG: alpha/beta hydrolase [Smithellaceae bacterium]